MSDSDEEDEYTEGKKVFDSDSEAEEEEEINENALPTDKKRVLDFFNDATEPELVAIQGMKIFTKMAYVQVFLCRQLTQNTTDFVHN
jgi:hypothetical protein